MVPTGVLRSFGFFIVFVLINTTGNNVHGVRVRLDKYSIEKSEVVVPNGWDRIRSANDAEGDLVTLTIAIKQRNVEELEDIFWKVSDPRHPQYGSIIY